MEETDLKCSVSKNFGYCAFWSAVSETTAKQKIENAF